MRKLTLLFIMIAGIVSAQTDKTVTIEDKSFKYETERYGDVSVELIYKTTKPPNNMTDEQLQKVIGLTFYIAKNGLKSRRSFAPVHCIVKYKHHKKGKHKYSVSLTYSGTNSYGGEVEDIIIVEYNHKLRETFGSALLRAN